MNTISNFVVRVVRGKPRSLGDGLRRVVTAAGNGRKGQLVGITQGGAKKVAGSQNVGDLFSIETKDGIATRRYSNGVELRYGDISAGRMHKFGAFSMPFNSGGVLGVFRPNGKVYAGVQATSWPNFRGDKLNHLVEKFVGPAQAKKEDYFSSAVEQAFKALE